MAALEEQEIGSDILLQYIEESVSNSKIGYVKIPYLTQKCSHKKKRINKKWKKRYGETVRFRTVKAKVLERRAEDVPYNENAELTFTL